MNPPSAPNHVRGYKFFQREPGRFELFWGRQWSGIVFSVVIGSLISIVPLVTAFGLHHAIIHRDVPLVVFTSLILILFVVLLAICLRILLHCGFPRQITFDTDSRTIIGRHIPGFDRRHAFDEFQFVELGAIGDYVWIRLRFRAKRRPLNLVIIKRLDESSAEELTASVISMARFLASLLDCPLEHGARWSVWSHPLWSSSWW